MPKIKRSIVHFFLVFVAIIAYSLATGVALDDVFEFDESTPSSPSPVTASPTPIQQGETLGQSDLQETVIVSEVIDGDTIILSTGERVRYIGVDTPETLHPTTGVQCYGNEASQANEAWVLGKEVRLEKDVSETDRYGRLLRYVWLEGEMINQKLVAQGYAIAKAYPPDTKYKELFEQTQAAAQLEKGGLWGKCTSVK